MGVCVSFSPLSKSFMSRVLCAAPGGSSASVRIGGTDNGENGGGYSDHGIARLPLATKVRNREIYATQQVYCCVAAEKSGCQNQIREFINMTHVHASFPPLHAAKRTMYVKLEKKVVRCCSS